MFNSTPIEFKPDSVLMEVNGAVQELPNDFVWVFAGGIPPNEFLKKIGIQFGMRDMTAEATYEAHQARAARQLVQA
jgi:thioredoxin reductase